MVDRIKVANGVWQETIGEIQGVIEDYFSKLFTASNIQGKLSDMESVKQVSEVENAGLLAKITNVEVKDAMFSMHPGKVSGFDGSDPAFY